MRRLLETVWAFKFPFSDLDTFLESDSHAASNNAPHYRGAGHSESILCMILSALRTLRFELQRQSSGDFHGSSGLTSKWEGYLTFAMSQTPATIPSATAAMNTTPLIQCE